MSGDTEQQYTVGFDEWFNKSPYGPYELLKEAWSEASLRMERVKDAAYGKIYRRFEREIRPLRIEIDTRKRVHWDDYERAGVLIAGLKQIQAICNETHLSPHTLDAAEKLAVIEHVATFTLREALKTWRQKDADEATKSDSPA